MTCGCIITLHMHPAAVHSGCPVLLKAVHHNRSENIEVLMPVLAMCLQLCGMQLLVAAWISAAVCLQLSLGQTAVHWSTYTFVGAAAHLLVSGRALGFPLLTCTLLLLITHSSRCGSRFNAMSGG